MITQQEFQQKLEALLSRAEAESFHIKKEEAESFFSGDELTGEQMKLVFDYLLSKKIIVEGYLKETALPELSVADLQYLEEYESALKMLAPERNGERTSLLEKILNGDKSVRERLSELFLPEVVKAARERHVPEVAVTDLVQEGNLCLLLALEAIEGRAGLDLASAEDKIMQEIRQGMQALTEQQRDVKHQDHRMVSKVQELKDSVSVLKEEMGRKVYLDEVADFMHISEDEAEAILKLAGEEVPEEE